MPRYLPCVRMVGWGTVRGVLIDPLLPPKPPRRPRYADGTWRDGVAQLLAVLIIFAGMFATIGVAELVARVLEGDRSETSAGASTPLLTDLWVGDLGQSGPVELGTPDTVREPDVSSPDDAVGKRYAPASCDWVLPIMEQHGLPRWMVAVAYRESRCLPGAYNGDRSTGDDSYGLFQINTLGSLWREVQQRCKLGDRRDLFDPERNISCAARLYKAYGYQPWDRGTYFK